MELLIRGKTLRSAPTPSSDSPAPRHDADESKVLTRRELVELFGPEFSTIKPLPHVA